MTTPLGVSGAHDAGVIEPLWHLDRRVCRWGSTARAEL
jgi:hypothetical protein